MAASWWGGAGANAILIGFNISFLVFTFFAAFMVLQLLVFHLGLKREEITTYQYIIRESARKRDGMMLGQKIRQRRVAELETAGNGVEALCLKMGGAKICTRCDPVRALVLQEMEQVDARNESNNGVIRGGVNVDADDADDADAVDDDNDEDSDKFEDEETAKGALSNGGMKVSPAKSKTGSSTNTVEKAP